LPTIKDAKEFKKLYPELDEAIYYTYKQETPKEDIL
jgi:hypothetical protein